jgi:alkanesulfonate monooxygenase SsuD/methylene tetrahydromethanopterin reductase-like flavin-dependent oxidoreductase (luciferase family)
VAATSQATFASAARAGLGVLGFTAVPPEELAPAVAAYRENQAGADPSDFFGIVPNFQVAAFMTAHCDTDDRRGRAIAGAAARWYLGDNDAPLNRVRFGPEFDRGRFTRYTDDALIRDRMVIGGDPDTCSRVIESWVGAGVDHLILMVQAGLTSHDDVMRAIELLGTQVLPRFQGAS